jgi:hypothetical protein
VEIFFTLAGIVAVGVVVGYLVTPLIFYLMEVTAYVAVLLVDVQIKKRYARQQLGRFPKWNDLPDSISRPLSGHYCDNKKRRIEYPQPIHDSRPRIEHARLTPATKESIAQLRIMSLIWLIAKSLIRSRSQSITSCHSTGDSMDIQPKWKRTRGTRTWKKRAAHRDGFLRPNIVLRGLLIWFRGWHFYSPASFLRTLALSVLSHGKSRSSLPKCP